MASDGRRNALVETSWECPDTCECWLAYCTLWSRAFGSLLRHRQLYSDKMSHSQGLFRRRRAYKVTIIIFNYTVVICCRPGSAAAAENVVILLHPCKAQLLKSQLQPRPRTGSIFYNTTQPNPRPSQNNGKWKSNTFAVRKCRHQTMRFC